MNNPPLPLSAARRAGALLFLSGQIALERGLIVDADIAAQTNRVIDAIEAQLSIHGLNLNDVVKTSVWLTNAEDFSAFNRIYAARFEEPYPARSTVVSSLVVPGAMIEIEIVASFDGR